MSGTNKSKLFIYFKYCVQLMILRKLIKSSFDYCMYTVQLICHS